MSDVVLSFVGYKSVQNWIWLNKCKINEQQFCLSSPVLLQFFVFKCREGYRHCILLFCLFRSKVHGLCYAPHAKKLVSCSEDGIVRIWDMNVKRQEVHNQLAGSQSVCLSVSLWVSQSVSQSVTQSARQSVSESVSQRVSQSVSQSVSLAVSQWVSQSACLSVCKSGS